ncbi:hypothetical protein BDW74DRAFT_155740 [Aspergillus multicolor]|uniref:response regulator n=1 Tax=Aspergillus multicolor TaxID=41759 RepID=UPI003CCCAA16
MSERRWSTRIKAKAATLLRRSSSSSRHSKTLLVTTTSNISASTHDLRPQRSHHSHRSHQLAESASQGKKAEEPAEPNSATTSTTTTTPPISTPNVASNPPPLSSASRPSISSFTESQYTPDELASAGTPGGQYFFVPDYKRPTSPVQREEQSVNQSSPAKTITEAEPEPQPEEQQTAPRRSNHDRERAQSGSSRKSFPTELLNFPLPPSRKSDSSVPLSPTRLDRSSAPLNASPSRRERPVSGPTEQPPTPLQSVAEKSAVNTYQSFPLAPTFLTRPSVIRRQSLLPASHQHLVTSILDTGSFTEPEVINREVPTMGSGMGLRKIWVRRPGGSATLLPTSEDALVDELRDQVVVKYANSLGKTFDAPDIIIRITTREGVRLPTPDRMLSPEEPLWTVVDSYYPGGQTVAEALVIEIPQRRTPKPSPRRNVYFAHGEPGEHGDYFPLMPTNINLSTPPTHHSNTANSAGTHGAPSISILTTGHAPPVPSPGGRAHRRPPLTRHTTHSPTLRGIAQSKESVSSQTAVPTQPTPPVVPTPPGPPAESPKGKVHTPPARVASPRPGPAKPKKSNRASLLNGAFGGLIEGTVPPINVLIVEDNVINQRLLEAFMKRLSVRWKCAANGQEAVTKWREGGFHLVLMDIQLPVMNGLDATKEIRRLERLNGIGVFPKKTSGESEAQAATSQDRLTEEDTLHDLSLFKSPVIIVALTASSLQSDRHEALAAGCNDFLTKPVRFEWLQQKVTEWGCMQALIDFEGWRRWRGFVASESNSHANSGRSSPETRNGTRKISAASPSPSPSVKKLSHLRKNDLVDDSPDSGDGSDSPASLHADGPSPLQEGAL